MALLDLWQAIPNLLTGKTLEQVIKFAGDGKLKDGNTTSEEYRSLLEIISLTDLCRYGKDCLDSSFENSGFALQDIINQAGRRLGFQTIDGRYRGRQNLIGFDGLWSSSDGYKIVVEVKTTDAYRINLNSVAKYRNELIQRGDIQENQSSILIVVGREDTGELEAQIRGSKYAWDVRLISVDSLFRLVHIREEIEGPSVANKICNILRPQEYTRIDGIIDLVFETTAEVKLDDGPIDETSGTGLTITPIAGVKPPKFTPVNFHADCIERINHKLGLSLVKRTKATYIFPTNDTKVVCAISREHPYNPDTSYYWFAFHPHQKELLSSASTSYVAFGCGSAEITLLIPFKDFEPWLEGMNMTKKEDREYWHVHIAKTGDQMILDRKAGSDNIDLSKYLLVST